MNNEFIRMLDQSKYLDDVYLSWQDIKNKFMKTVLEYQRLQINLQKLYKPLLKAHKDIRFYLTTNLTDLKKKKLLIWKE